MSNPPNRQNAGVWHVDFWPPPSSGVRRMRGRPKAPLVLTDDERAALEELAHTDAATPEMAQRARIVLACATGKTNLAVAAQLSTGVYFVGKWRARFVRYRAEGLFDRPHLDSDASSAIAQFKEAVARAVKEVPRGDVALLGAVVRVTVRLP